MSLNMLYVAVFLYVIAFPGADSDCNETYDPIDCVYNINCNGEISYRFYRNFEVNSDRGIECKYTLIQNEFEPLIVYFDDNKRTYETPEFLRGENHMLSLTITLNISNNEYNDVPVIPRMENLATLDISRNHLRTAILSNKNELPSLTKIDLSHNNINNIATLSSDKYPYDKLVDINLSYNLLTTIPDAVFEISTDLESLDISHNLLTALTMFTFEGVKNLKKLQMSDNRIVDLGSSLFRFTKLTTLNMKNNKLREIKISDFDKLINLRSLDLSSNLISSYDEYVFNNMSLLTLLDLSNNQLKSISTQTFSRLKNLKEIDLSVNHLSALPRGLFKDKSLSAFSIEQNSLSGSLVKGTFEGLEFVTQLDLSNQQLTSIEDLAFYGLDNVQKILLNNNKIHSLSKNCFKTIQRVIELDLSNNKITKIDFNKDDLSSLQSLILRNNLIIEVNQQYFENLHLLQYLDLSYNNISQLDRDSFKTLKELINFEISNNPLSGALEENTFEGLNSLPSLDISRTMITSISNNSFMSMLQLRNLNVSHSKINNLQYNAFHKTGAIQIMDLSFNEMDTFNVNTTELIGLQTLLLNGNRLTSIGKDTLRGLVSLIKIVLSNNNILSVDDNAFIDQMDLRYLDLANNPHLNFNISRIKANKNLNSLYLSGITSGICFINASDIPISLLDVSYAKLRDPKTLKLNELAGLDTLALNNNNIVKLDSKSFANVKSLRILDLSFNKISAIQPGTFIDNSFLYSLNLSHNALTTLGYGMFRGLIYLHTLDISYNEINSLQSERFYEVASLSVLVADHNRIATINADDFFGTSLTTLSIGENPLPCEILVNLKKLHLSFVITAIKLDEKSDNENINGVTCNMNNLPSSTFVSDESFDKNDTKILVQIRDILLNGNKILQNMNKEPVQSENKSLTDIINTIEKSYVNATNQLESKLLNETSVIVKQFNSTNTFLGKILKILPTNWRSIYMPAKENNNQSLVPYIEGIRMDLENSIATEKERINELNMKIATLNSRIDSVNKAYAPVHEKYVANDVQSQPEPLFTKICVALILSILLCAVLFKFYKSRMFIRKRLSISTRELPGAMEHSAL